MKTLRMMAFCGAAALLAQDPTSPPQDSGGPVILNRGGAPQPGRSAEWLRLRPYARVSAIYDTGLSGLYTDEQGRLARHDAYGVLAGFGVVGYHSWRHTTLGVSYDAEARHYSRSSYYDGVNQSLGLTLSHQATRRVFLDWQLGAASRLGGWYGMSGLSFYQPEFSEAAQDLLFDHRTYLFTSLGRVVFQKSARLSLGMSGVAAAIEPHSRALMQARAAGATGDLAYRVSRRQTVGVVYRFDHFWFPRAFGEAYAHGAFFQYSVLLGRRWTLAAGAGGHRVEMEGLRRVALDPLIAILIGQRMGIEAFHRINYIPGGQLSLTRAFRRGSLTLSYQRGISPGNGVYLTSARESAGISVGYTGTRRLHLGADAGYSRLSSLSYNLGRYRNYYAGGGMTYSLLHSLSWVVRIDGRKYDLGGTSFSRVSYRVMTGLAFSPGDFPLSLW